MKVLRIDKVWVIIMCSQPNDFGRDQVADCKGKRFGGGGMRLEAGKQRFLAVIPERAWVGAAGGGSGFQNGVISGGEGG